MREVGSFVRMDVSRFVYYGHDTSLNNVPSFHKSCTVLKVTLDRITNSTCTRVMVLMIDEFLKIVNGQNLPINVPYIFLT